MKPDSYFLPFAESAFNAYGDEAQWKTWDDKPMPQWEAVGEKIQARWLAAIKAVFAKLNVRDADTQELSAKINIKIDGEPFAVLPPMTAAGMLELTGVDPVNHHIERILDKPTGHPQRYYDDVGMTADVPIHDGDRFLTVYTGPTTNQ